MGLVDTKIIKNKTSYIFYCIFAFQLNENEKNSDRFNFNN